MYARAVYYAVKNGVSTDNEMLNYVHKNWKLLKRSVRSHQFAMNEINLTNK